VPIAAPSANVSGRPSPTCAEHVLADLDGKLKLVLDAGPTGIGVESTVVEAAGDRAVVLRPGGLPVESIKKVVSEVVPGQGVEFDETPSSPGLKYTHYSPEASLFLVDCGTRGRTVECLKREAARAAGLGRRVGILCARESAEHYRELEAEVQHLGSYSVLKEVAAKLFWALRELDNRGCEVVFAEGFPKRELGLAVMDRLTRAADRVITDQEELS
jgi:L-threonylcarbamoyladenylate synthase